MGNGGEDLCATSQRSDVLEPEIPDCSALEVVAPFTSLDQRDTTRGPKDPNREPRKSGPGTDVGKAFRLRKLADQGGAFDHQPADDGFEGSVTCQIDTGSPGEEQLRERKECVELRTIVDQTECLESFGEAALRVRAIWRGDDRAHGHV